ncbi:MAG TPA: carboxyl transferase domain-containing protein [Bryobacteraceae bacterium]|jgi:acetyl-CoA carboxylase carboxyltransferase component|nr:carboxyl transferase domain-containing protein [Bryobacteraceae bacterium]
MDKERPGQDPEELAHPSGGESWQREVDEIRRRTELAGLMGGRANIERQHQAGRLTVRERIDALLDEGSFHETGALAGKAEYDAAGHLTSFTPSNFVAGTGRIDGRRVVVGGDDFTVRGGAADGVVGNKAGYAEKLALGLRLPMIRLVDGTGGGGSVKTLETTGRTYVPANPSWDTVVELLGEVPVIGACLGPVAGLGAVRVATSHFSIMVRGVSQLFVAGPPVVERGIGEKVGKEDLGGSFIHAHGSGAVDNEVETEADAFQQIRRFLSYLPSNVWQIPPHAPPSDDPQRREEALLSSIPRDRRRSYDVRRILGMIVDRDSFFEIGKYYGRPLAAGLARLNGYPIGVMANDPRKGGGAVDAAASEKMIRFIDLCDTFHLPVVNFVDNPGFLIGTTAERAGTVRIGSRALVAVYQATVPWISIIIRRVFGVAGAAHGNAQGLNLRYAWPSGDWGSLPIEGGVQAAYKREIEAAPDPASRRREIEERLNTFRSPFRTAENFGIEEIIDPRDTRPLLCEWVETAYGLLPSELGPKRRKTRV